MIRTQVLKHLPGARKGKREGRKRDFRRGEQWRRVGEKVRRDDPIKSLRGKRSEEMTRSNTSSPRGSEVPFESKKG